MLPSSLTCHYSNNASPTLSMDTSLSKSLDNCPPVLDFEKVASYINGGEGVGHALLELSRSILSIESHDEPGVASYWHVDLVSPIGNLDPSSLSPLAQFEGTGLGPFLPHSDGLESSMSSLAKQV
ncbi:hypothetical protein Ancab_012374 [Ancistrocladus abbreviatus]